MPPINARVLKEGLDEMAKIGYDLSYISARIDQHAPPVHNSTIKGWLNGTIQPTDDQISYIESIVRISGDDLLDLGR